MSHNNLGPLLAVLFAAGVYLLVRHRDATSPAGLPAPGAAPTTPGTPPAGAPAPGGWTLTKPLPDADPTLPGATGPGATLPGTTLPTGARPTWSPPPPAPPPVPPRPARQRSVLGRLTFALVLVGLGVLGAADLGGADVLLSAYPALVLALAGAALLLGAWFGRGRGLIALGVLAALALPPLALADAFHGSWVGGDRLVRPVDVAGLAPAYEFGAGRVRLDLSAVDFTGAAPSTGVDLGAGELVVTVPAKVDVTVSVDLGVGEAQILAEHGSGFGVEKDVTDLGPDGSGGGELHLNIDQGIGRVEVRRAAA